MSSTERLPVSMGILLGFLTGFSLAMGPIGFALGAHLYGNGGGTIAAVPSVPSVPSIPSDTAPVAAPTADNVPAVDPKTDHILGNPDAQISVIEYSDFECPFCKRHHPTIQQLTAKYGDKINIVYRHFPLSFHPAAQPAAEASECVAEIGGNDMFWKFVDKAFGVADQLTVEQVPQIVKELGVDQKKFDDCIAKGAYKQKITDQMNGGSAAGVDGTPGNVIIDHKTNKTQLVSGAVPLASFTQAIDPLLQ